MQYINYSILQFQYPALHTKLQKFYCCSLSLSERPLFIHLFELNITMHPQMFISFATLVITAYAASSSSVSMKAISIVELIEGSSVTDFRIFVLG